MKKFLKVSLLIAGGMLVVAAILVAVAFFMNDGHFSSGIHFGGDPGERKEYVTESVSLEKLYLKDHNKGVDILATTGDKIRVTYYESDRMTYDIREDNGTLSIVSRDERKWFDRLVFFNWGEDLSSNVTVEVPQEQLLLMDVETSNGHIEMSDVAVGDGSTIHSSNARIEVRNTKMEGEVRLKSSNGKIILDGVTGEEVEADTSNAKVELNNIAFEKIDVDTSNGKIELEGSVIADDITLKSSNGKIEGQIEGKESDYDITSKTSNGGNSLPEERTGGSKRLWVKTSNAKIDLYFTER